jgi:hypothetical protein
MSDRYLKIVLTNIALELGWIALGPATSPLSAQAGAQAAAQARVAPPTRVVITGVDLASGEPFIPVGVVGAYRQIPAPLRREIERVVVNVDTQSEPLRVETVGPVKVEADRPLPVESVKYTPGQRPGE